MQRRSVARFRRVDRGFRQRRCGRTSSDGRSAARGWRPVHHLLDRALLVSATGTTIRTRMANASERMAAAAAGRPQRQSADLLSNIYVKVDGDTATARSRFTFLSEYEDGSFRVRGSGLYVDIWKREDGAWRIQRRTVTWDLLAGQSAAPAAN